MQIASTPDHLPVRPGGLRSLRIGLAIHAVPGLRGHRLPSICGSSTLALPIGAVVALRRFGGRARGAVAGAATEAIDGRPAAGSAPGA